MEEDENLIGCAIYVPQVHKSFPYKLNPWTSSFIAEVFVLNKAIDMIKNSSWQLTNICTDSLRLILAIENLEQYLF